MRLAELFRGLPVRLPDADPEVRGVTHDSRRVAPGDLYVAIVGGRFDGRDFVRQAMARGAVAVLGPGAAPAGAAVPWVAAEEPRALLGPVAARLAGHPDGELVLAGVTGTNGKSTVVALLAEVLSAAGLPCAVLGTLGYRFGALSFAAERTTPEASDLFALLRRMVEAGARAAAMEVSSHALTMGRVEGARFALAVFTNLTRDHLDYHADLESYFAAKRRLFDQLADGGGAVVNVGDPWGRRLAAELPRVITYGPGGEVAVTSAELTLTGSRAVVETPRGELALRARLLGRYNLENVTAAVAAAELLELPHAAVAEGIGRLAPLPGRLEPVGEGGTAPVLIDYAHTPAALEAALRSLRELTRRKIAVLFGCGGERDPGKRPLMGRIAGELAELPFVTSDNPRHEDPLAILAAVEEGLVASGNPAYRVVPDRREAIRRALTLHREDWVVLVAGKGHEAVQDLGERVVPFSDRREVEAALEERLGCA